MINVRPKVIVAIPTNGNDGREQLSGVFDYINEHPDWELQIIHSRTDVANGTLESALGNANGFVLSIAYGTFSSRIVRSAAGSLKCTAYLVRVSP